MLALHLVLTVIVMRLMSIPKAESVGPDGSLQSGFKIIMINPFKFDDRVVSRGVSRIHCCSITFYNERIQLNSIQSYICSIYSSHIVNS